MLQAHRRLAIENIEEGVLSMTVPAYEFASKRHVCGHGYALMWPLRCEGTAIHESVELHGLVTV